MSSADRDLALQRAVEQIEEVFAEKAKAVAQEMVALATGAESEAVRFQAGREIVRQVRGEATQRVEHRSVSVNFRGKLDLPMARIDSLPASVPALQAPGDGVLPEGLPSSSPSVPSIRRLELQAPETPGKLIDRMRKMKAPATVGGVIQPEPHTDGSHERVVPMPDLTPDLQKIP